jgi:hypothetical protein
MKNDLDSMLENFLMDNDVEDNGFSQSVMAQLPQQSAWAWLKDFVPAFAFSALCVFAWNFHELFLQSLFMYRSEFYQWFNANISTASISISYTTLAAVGVVAAYFLLEKVMHEIETF